MDARCKVNGYVYVCVLCSRECMVHVCVLSVISYNAASTDAGLITERMSRSTVSRRSARTHRANARERHALLHAKLSSTRYVNAAAYTGVSCAHLIFRAPPLFQVLSAPQAPQGGVAGAAAPVAKNGDLVPPAAQKSRRKHESEEKNPDTRLSDRAL